MSRCFGWTSLSVLRVCLDCSHTKFFPDAAFGVFKRRYAKHSVCQTMEDVAEVCNESGVCNEAILYSQDDAEEPAWCWYQWTDYLSALFIAPEAVSSYYWFKVDCRKPGILQCSTCPRGQGEIVERNLVKVSLRLPSRPRGVNPSERNVRRYAEQLRVYQDKVLLVLCACKSIMQTMIVRQLQEKRAECISSIAASNSFPVQESPLRLSNMRQWYLFDTVRLYASEASANLLYPEPDVPRPQAQGGQSEAASTGHGRGRGRGV
jgi:hypothetical protein